MVTIERKKFSLKKNDQVEVIAGNEKGKTGKILKIDGKSDRVTIERVNLVKRHMKPTQTTSGGIVERELPIHYSNVLIFCQKCNRGVRHGFKWIDRAESKKGQKADQAKVRICKRCKETIDVA